LLPPKHLDFTRLFYQWAVPGRPDAVFPFSWRTKELAPIAGEYAKPRTPAYRIRRKVKTRGRNTLIP
jgi:hypothetical protein